MGYAPVYYTALDMGLMLRRDSGHWSSSAREVLAIVGISDITLGEIENGVIPNTPDTLIDLFRNAADGIAGSASTAARNWLGDRKYPHASELVRSRLAPTAVDPDVLFMFGRAMGATVNLSAGDVIVGISTGLAVDGPCDVQLSLPKDIVWTIDKDDAEHVRIGSALPSTVLAGLGGQPLSHVFEHAILGDPVPLILSTSERSGSYTILQLARREDLPKAEARSAESAIF